MTKDRDESSTREIILNTALTLFAKSGYQDISMREIAAKAGIRASSIYNHFESKMEILDSLITVVQDHIALTIYKPLESDIDSFRKDPEKFLERNYLASYDLFFSTGMAEIMRVILEGQFVSEKIREFLSDALINKPLSNFTAFFERLSREGYQFNFEPAILAEEYLSFGVARYYRHTLCGNFSMLQKKDEVKAYRRHLHFFAAAAGLQNKPNKGNTDD